MPDILDWPSDQKLYLSGAAHALKLPVAIGDYSKLDGGIAEVSFAKVRGPDGQPLRTLPVQMGLVPGPKDTARGQIRLKLDRSTPAGRYAGQAEIAGMTRPVEIDVVETIALSVRPAPLVIDGNSVQSHGRTISVQNRGNVPLTIDLTGTYALGKEQPVASEPARPPGGGSDGIDQLIGLIETAFGRAARPVLKESGTITIAMPDGPIRIAAGGEKTVPIAVSLDQKSEPSARYRAYVPLYSEDLEILFVTARKGERKKKATQRKKTPATDRNPRKKGAAT